MLVALIVVAVTIVAIAAAWRGHLRAPRWPTLGLALLPVGATALLALLTYTSWNPPNSARIAVAVCGVVAWIAANVLAATAWRRGDRLTGGVAALLSAASVVALVVMVGVSG